MPPPPPFSILVAFVVADGVDEHALQPAADTLESFGIGWEVVAAGGDKKFPALRPGLRAVIVAAPDGRLPGALAAGTGLPVVRVPSEDGARRRVGLICDEGGNLPAGAGEGEVFATVAIGAAGARNAALFIVAALALEDAHLREAWLAFRARQTEAVLQHPPLTMAEN